MDRSIWNIITKTLIKVNRKIPRTSRRCSYSDLLIVRMYIWSVWHDRPLYWACQREHYNTLFRPQRLPSVSQFSRRVRSRRVALLIESIEKELIGQLPATGTMFFDGKALPVSESTRDPHAKTGRGNGLFSRGYKLHALGDENGCIRAFTVRPLNEHEVPTARNHLVKAVPAGTLVLADGNYDGQKLYADVDARKATLFTPLRGQHATDPNRIRRMPPGRRLSHWLWGKAESLCWLLYRQRSQIERIFSALTTFAGGLGPLPSWVRTLPRVTRWVTVKVMIYHARLLCRLTKT